MNERKALEKAAFGYFIELYNQLRSTSFKVKKHQDRPDFVAEDCVSGEVVGIEIRHLYYDDEDAKMLLGPSIKELHELHGPMKHTDWIETLNASLQDKDSAARKYNCEHRMILVVRVAPSSPFDKSTLQMYEDDIVIPPNVFDEIWLLFYNSSRQAWTDLKRLK